MMSCRRINTSVYEEEHLGNFPHAELCSRMAFPAPMRPAETQVGVAQRDPKAPHMLRLTNHDALHVSRRDCSWTQMVIISLAGLTTASCGSGT